MAQAGSLTIWFVYSTSPVTWRKPDLSRYDLCIALHQSHGASWISHDMVCLYVLQIYDNIAQREQVLYNAQQRAIVSGGDCAQRATHVLHSMHGCTTNDSLE